VRAFLFNAYQEILVEERGGKTIRGICEFQKDGTPLLIQNKITNHIYGYYVNSQQYS
jgi:hypothetical protein